MTFGKSKSDPTRPLFGCLFDVSGSFSGHFRDIFEHSRGVLEVFGGVPDVSGGVPDVSGCFPDDSRGFPMIFPIFFRKNLRNSFRPFGLIAVPTWDVLKRNLFAFCLFQLKSNRVSMFLDSEFLDRATPLSALRFLDRATPLPSSYPIPYTLYPIP